MSSKPFSHQRGFQIGDTQITRLSGPVSAYFLKPTDSFLSLMKQHQSRPPLFLFLGDIHESNKGQCTPCKEDTCFHIDKENLFSILNQYSSPQYPIHVYLEWFLSKEYKQQISQFSPKEASKFFQDEINSLDPQDDGPLINVTFKHLACFFPQWKSDPAYQPVFRKFCKNSNIQWHHVDMRKIINIYQYGIQDEREHQMLLGKYIFEGLLHAVMMDPPFDTFRDLLWVNPRQAAVHFIAEAWKYSLTHEETKFLAKTLRNLFVSPQEFSKAYIDTENPLFENRSIIRKQILKQIKPLQEDSVIQTWTDLILRYYLTQQESDWNERTYHKKTNTRPEKLLAVTKEYLFSFFHILYELLDQYPSVSSHTILQSKRWNELISSQKRDILRKCDAEYMKALLEDIGLATTCTFVDLGILLRSFKNPVHKTTGQIEPTPYLSICYFGDDHMKSLIDLLVNQLKLYTFVSGNIDHVRASRGKGLRCLNLQSLQWNLEEEAKSIGVAIPKPVGQKSRKNLATKRS